MKTVSVTANASDPQALHRKALAAALAQQQGGLGFSGQQAAPAVAGNAGLALALGNFGASAAQGIMASREADKQAAATEAARSRFSRMVGSYAPGGPGAGGGPGRSPSGPVAGNFQGAGSSENAATAVRYFQDKGLPEHSARALVGGFQAESGSTLNTGARNRGDGTDGSDSIGIGQWNSGRAAAMRQFAASSGRNPGDLHTQLDFAWQELNGPEKATLNRLMTAKDDHDATAAAVGYERPAGWSADNPTAAVTFGERLANTTALAGLGQSAPTATASADMPASNAQPATAPGLPGDMMSAPQSAAATAAADAMPGNDSDVRMSPGSVPAFFSPQQRALASALMTPDGASPGLTPANPNGAPDVVTQPSDLMNNAPRPDQGGMNTKLGGFTGSPYGEIPATTGDPSAQSLAWALGQQMGGQSTAPSLGTDATLSQSNARSQAQGGAAFPADVGAAIGADSGVPAIMGASFVSDKARGQGGVPFADMSGSIRNGSPAPQMAGADVPLPPVRPNQAVIDALGAPQSSGNSGQVAVGGNSPQTDPTPTGSIDMGGAANMPAPNAQPAVAPGIPPSALAAALGDGGPGGGFSPIGKNANFQTPTQFNLQQSGGSSGGNPLVAALASYTPGQQAPAPTPAGPSPQALAGALGQGSAFRAVMDGGDIQKVAQQQDARLNGPGNAVLANALGGGPAIIPAPAGAPPAQAGGWQQDAASILSDPYATPQMQAYAKDLLDKANARPEGFTMHAGDVRFDGYGRQIAAVPKDQQDRYDYREVGGRLIAVNKADPSDVRDATPAGMPSGYRPATPQERQAYGVQDSAPLMIGPDGKPQSLGGGTNVTVNNAVNPILKGLGDQFVTGAEEARAAADTVRSIQTARAQLSAPGGIVSGQFANPQLALQKAGAALGLGDTSSITNTETFRAAVKPIVLSTVKGLGSGSGISNADRDFAERAVGGSITLDASSIGRIMDITERAARAKIDRHNGLADQMLKTQPDLAAVSPMLRIQAPPEIPMGGGGGAPGGAAAGSQGGQGSQPAGLAAPSPQQRASATAAPDQAITEARTAIASGKSRAAVIQRLQQLGISPEGL